MTDRPEPMLSTSKALALALLPLAGIAACAVAAGLKGTRGWWSLLPWIALACIALAPGVAGWVAARTRRSTVIASVPAIAFAVVVLAFAGYTVVTGQRIRAPEALLIYLIPLGWILGTCLIALRLARSGRGLLAVLVGAVVMAGSVAVLTFSLFLSM